MSDLESGAESSQSSNDERRYKKNPRRTHTPPRRASKTKLALIPLLKSIEASGGYHSKSSQPIRANSPLIMGPLDFPNIDFIDNSDAEDGPNEDTPKELEYWDNDGKANNNQQLGTSVLSTNIVQDFVNEPAGNNLVVDTHTWTNRNEGIGLRTLVTSASLCGRNDLLDNYQQSQACDPRLLTPSSEFNFMPKHLRWELQNPQRNTRKSFTADSTTSLALAAAISPGLVAHSVGDLGSLYKVLHKRHRVATSTSSLASMISLPGVPPVPGVSETPLVSGSRLMKPLIPGGLASTSNVRLNSEENLILKYQRQKEFSGMRPTKLRQESSILKNIQRREMIDKVMNFSKQEKREKEEKQRLKAEFDIASGLLRTRAILLAPTTPLTLSGSTTQPTTPDDDNTNSIHSFQYPSIQTTFLPEKPSQRRIVRKVVESQIHHSPEMKELAETRFSESEFVLECLEWHNRYRKKHSAPPLQFDAILCATAQHWANMLAHRDEFCHQNPPNVGENLFAWPVPLQTGVSLSKKKPPDVSGKDVAVYWYMTHRNYDYSKSPKVLHSQAAQFTQMVWTDSKRFGCGKARSRSGKVIAVAHYQPKGNLPGFYHMNVFVPEAESEIEENEQNNDCDKDKKKKK